MTDRNAAPTQRRHPLSTYRLQLHAKFGFADAQHQLAYLDELGISDIYSSPYLKAGRGSMHGYDVVNPTVLNDELGAIASYRAFSDEMLRRNLGHVLDVVPNHMGIGEGNEWWWDVLESGLSSRYANHFDIDWTPPKESLRGKVLLPVLGGQFSELLEKGELKLRRDGALLVLAYYDHRFPLAPHTVSPILLEAEQRLRLDESALARQELRSVARALRSLGEQRAETRAARLERSDELAVIRRRLSALLVREKEIAGAVDAVLTDWSGKPGEPASFDKLERLISEQHYRLADWHVAAEEINYRRFFDINQLAALRMEDPLVFEESHAFVLKLLREGRATGVRLDHTDGLRDPLEYFQRLRAHIQGNASFYIVAEKILGTGEQLPPAWPIDGTTGYDTMTALSGLFVDSKNEAPMTALYRDFTGDVRSYEEHALESRRLIMRASLPSEIHTLARALETLAGEGRRPHDFTNAALHQAIIETVAAFPVYRTYLRADGTSAPADAGYIEEAIGKARARNPELDGGLFDYLRDVLLLAPLPGADEKSRAAQIRFVLRFQQLTPPMMAKGVEDTAFYTYRRLLALNDVGGDPGRFGTRVAGMHEQNRLRREQWPLTMLASSTHDNKRGEDVRARLAVLSEIPERWGEAVRGWSELLARYRTASGESSWPGRDDEYLFFQTVVGALPFDAEIDADFTERIAAYMLKALRESKQHTNWAPPNEPYEQAVERYIRGALADAPFRESLAGFTREIIPAGIVNGLAQVALKHCSPGVPDTYQGCEQWNLSLVDPDNRRPVDYAGLSKRLHALRDQLANPDRAALCGALLARAGDGDVKLFATHLLLRARREQPDLFLDGDYQPLETVDDRDGERVFAFTRTLGDRVLLCAVPRLVQTMTPGPMVPDATGAAMAGRTPGAIASGAKPMPGWPLGALWNDASLRAPKASPAARSPQAPAGQLRDLFTGRVFSSASPLRLAELFESFPAAVLLSEPR